MIKISDIKTQIKRVMGTLKASKEMDRLIIKITESVLGSNTHNP
jgi:hypothetical protein